MEKEYNMSLLDWTKVGEHYSKMLNSIGDDMEKHNTIHMPFVEAFEKWENHYKEHYKGESTDISGDIDF